MSLETIERGFAEITRSRLRRVGRKITLRNSDIERLRNRLYQLRQQNNEDLRRRAELAAALLSARPSPLAPCPSLEDQAMDDINGRDDDPAQHSTDA